MVKTSTTNQEDAAKPDALQRRRLKKLAVSNNILSTTPASTRSPLEPSKTVVKHHGKDILKKSQRKNRFLFSFPGLLAPLASGGKIGDLSDLGSKNPVLYLHFPQGEMKLFGTIVYPKNRYLTLQFSRGGKNVVCEDYFDSIIVFSEVWWIGKREENPEEKRLDFPTELIEGQCGEYEFKGGAGEASVGAQQVVHRSGKKQVEVESPETEMHDDLSDDGNDLKELNEAKPTRQSARTAGKTFKFTDLSSGDDSVKSDADGDAEEEKTERKPDTSSIPMFDIDDEHPGEGTGFHEEIQTSTAVETKSSTSLSTSKKELKNSHGSLVQSTISTLFKKVQDKTKTDEKKRLSSSKKPPSSKDSGQKSQPASLKRKTDEAAGPQKKRKIAQGEKSGTRNTAITKAHKVEDDAEEDEIEEFSGSSQDSNGSDDDWEA